MHYQHTHSVQLHAALTDSQSPLRYSVYNFLFNANYFRLFTKPSSGSTNYTNNAHPAHYLKYAINEVVNSKFWGNLCRGSLNK